MQAQSYAVFVRSPHAHAVIKSIDISAASAMPGVVRIFIGKDLEGKMGGLPCGWLITLNGFDPSRTTLPQPPSFAGCTPNSSNPTPCATA